MAARVGGQHWSNSCDHELGWCEVTTGRISHKLQAPVYDLLPSTTAIVHYAVGLEKLSANETVFDDAQKGVVCNRQLKLYQTFFFITDHVA